MSLSLAYWVLMLIWLVVGVVLQWPAPGAGFRPLGGTFVLFCLLLIIGWKVFGAPVHG
jgi:hypothetical protein